MRNAGGLSRSAEYLKANPGQAPKVHHIRIMPHEDGVRVTHHGSADGKSFADHHFSHGDGASLLAHISQHTGYKGGGLDEEAEDRESKAGANKPDGLAPTESEDQA